MNSSASDIKGVVCDLDGTLLLPNARLGDKTISVIKKCKKRGLKFLIATGRSIYAAEEYRRRLGIEGAMIYYNGAAVVDMPRAVTISNDFLPSDAALFCVKYSRANNLHFHVFFPGDNDPSTEILMSENPSEAAEVYAERTGLNFRYGDLLNELSGEAPPPCAKGLFIAEPEVLEKARSVLNEKFKGRLNIVKSAETFLEILNKTASKGNALVPALAAHGIKPSEALAFGDEENDITMLQNAGFSAAPSNAKKEVRAAAKIIIGTNEDEGVACFLEKNFL